MGGGGGGGGGAPPTDPSYKTPWSPHRPWTFGERPETREEYYETDKHGGDGIWWPRGGYDEEGNFREGEYSYNPVGEQNRNRFDFLRTGNVIRDMYWPGEGGGEGGGDSGPSSPSGTFVPASVAYEALFGGNAEAAVPRPELTPGGFGAGHPAFTPLQEYGGIMGGYSPRSGFSDPAVLAGQTGAPNHYRDDYEEAGLDFPGAYKPLGSDEVFTKGGGSRRTPWGSTAGTAGSDLYLSPYRRGGGPNSRFVVDVTDDLDNVEQRTRYGAPGFEQYKHAPIVNLDEL